MNTTETTETWLVNFDFESLYTNISSMYVHEIFMYAKDVSKIKQTFLYFMINRYTFPNKNAFFHIGHKEIYRQIEGLLMGSYHSLMTANNELLLHEFQLLQDENIQKCVSLYTRHVDDGFALVKFSIETVETVITINEDSLLSGKYNHNIYQKEFNTYSYVHRKSNHPKYIFKGIKKPR